MSSTSLKFITILIACDSPCLVGLGLIKHIFGPTPLVKRMIIIKKQKKLTQSLYSSTRPPQPATGSTTRPYSANTLPTDPTTPTPPSGAKTAQPTTKRAVYPRCHNIPSKSTNNNRLWEYLYHGRTRVTSSGDKEDVCAYSELASKRRERKDLTNI
jgi:hypothetical protein